MKLLNIASSYSRTLISVGSGMSKCEICLPPDRERSGYGINFVRVQYFFFWRGGGGKGGGGGGNAEHNSLSDKYWVSLCSKKVRSVVNKSLRHFLRHQTLNGMFLSLRDTLYG